jgi:hypothetical protein
MAFIFVPLLALTAIAFFFLWVYLSHVIVVIVEDTAAGNRELHWSDDPFTDWVWQGGYLAWVIGVWCTPALIVARIFTRAIHVEGHFAGAEISEQQVRWAVSLVAAMFVFWIFFPVSLLSTMSAESRWTVLHAGLFNRLARNPAAVLIYYLITGLLLVICVPLLLAMLFLGEPFSLILGALGLSAGIVLMSRLLGRLANCARLTEIRPRRKRAKTRVRREVRRRVEVADPWEVPEDAPEFPEPPPPRFVQPSEMPGVQTPYEGEVVGYDVRFDDGPVAPRPAARVELEAPVPLQEEDVGVAARRSAEDRAARQRAADIEPDKVEMTRAAQHREMNTPSALTYGIAGFLVQQGVAVQWITLALGIGFLALMIRGLQAFWPM